MYENFATKYSINANPEFSFISVKTISNAERFQQWVRKVIN